MGLLTHYIPLPNFDNDHFSNLILSLPLLILNMLKQSPHPFHLQTVLYELLTHKGFLFNHLTIITQTVISNSSISTSRWESIYQSRRCRFDPCVGRSPGSSAAALKYSCLENSVDRGAWRVTVPGITKAWTCLSN